MRVLQRALIGLAAAGLVFTLMSCEPEGPLERGGKKIDRAVEKTGDKVEDATDRK